MLTKRGKYWHIEFRLNGVRVSRSAKTDIRKDAAALEESLRRELWRTQELGQSSKYWKDGVELWRAKKAHKRSIKRDEQILELAGAKWGSGSLDEITEEEIVEHGQEIAKRSTAANASRHLAMLRSFFNLLHCHKYMARSLHITLYKARKYQAMVLSDELFKSFLEALPAAMRPSVEFARETGLRRSNVQLLHWTAARPGDPWRPYVANGTAYIPDSHAKAGRPITVPLSERALEILKALPRNGELIFAMPSRKGWDKAAQAAGVSGLRFHDLRHTWCSSHIRKGTPALIVQKLGGWQSDSMVKRYTQLEVEDLRKYV